MVIRPHPAAAVPRAHRHVQRRWLRFGRNRSGRVDPGYVASDRGRIRPPGLTSLLSREPDQLATGRNLSTVSTPGGGEGQASTPPIA
jgi:hypothetical protein